MSKRERRNWLWGVGILLFAMAAAGIIMGAVALSREDVCHGKCHHGRPGANGTCTGLCVNGTNGTDGLDGNSTVAGVAQFIYTTASPNDSRPPGTLFVISTTVYN